MITAVVFDCFGVLITDAFGLLVRDYEAKNPRQAAAILDLVRATNQGLIGTQDFTEKTAAAMAISPHELRERIDSGEVKDRELFAYIKELRKQYKTAVLSNVSAEGFWRRFTHEEVNKYFDSVVISGEIGHAKPEPEAFQAVADRLGIHLHDCVMVDDREEYLIGARALNMHTILYQNVAELRAKLDALAEDQR